MRLAVYMPLILAFTVAEFAQTAKMLNKPVSTAKTISGYMRDVGLLYIETVERGVDTMDDFDVDAPSELAVERSKQQFKLLDAMGDRVEIHTETKADKDFYEYGLKALRTLAQDKTYAQELRVKRYRQFPDVRRDPQEEEAETCRDSIRIRRYLKCDSELRSIIKTAEYKLDSLREDYCEIPKVDDTAAGVRALIIGTQSACERAGFFWKDCECHAH